MRRGVTWSLGGVLLVAVVTEAVLAPRLAPPGAPPDLLLVTTVVVAALAPPRAAVVFGFAAGLGADLFLTTPLGLSAAAFTAVARAAASFPVPRRALLVAPRVAAGALLAGVLVLLEAAALGGEGMPSAPRMELLARAAVTAGALSPVVFVLVRRLVAVPRPA
ncbi:MAG: rod shape-determining protein MreD [Acidimicrobiia bacterium]